MSPSRGCPHNQNLSRFMSKRKNSTESNMYEQNNMPDFTKVEMMFPIKRASLYVEFTIIGLSLEIFGAMMSHRAIIGEFGLSRSYATAYHWISNLLNYRFSDDFKEGKQRHCLSSAFIPVDVGINKFILEMRVNAPEITTYATILAITICGSCLNFISEISAENLRFFQILLYARVG